jgi:hypothetical protein
MSILQWDLMPRYLETKEPRQMKLQQLFRKILVLKNMDSKSLRFRKISLG